MNGRGSREHGRVGNDLSNAVLYGVSSGGIESTPGGLPDEWELVNGYLIGPQANLANAALSGADLSGDLLGGANLTGADLSNANLEGCPGGVIGIPASLPTNWKVLDGYLVGPGANLANAALPGADLSGDELSGAST